MATAKSVLAQIESLTTKELAALEDQWRKAGSVKRRWWAFVAGCAAGVAACLVITYLIGCGHSGTASTCPPVTATFCAPGPTVVP